MSYQHRGPLQTAAPRSSGVYALVRLDGGPISQKDCAALGLPDQGEHCSASLEAIDLIEPAACTRLEENGVVTVLAGFIEERELRARELGLDRQSCDARIAKAALARYAGETPGILVGEWSLIQWDPHAPGPTLTIMSSAARRDRLFFARSGPHVAIAPDLFALSHIDWVGTQLDEGGLLMQLGTAALRRQAGERTMLCAVSQLGPGEGKRFTHGREPLAWRCNVLPCQPRWTGTPRDALAEAEALIVQIMRERLARIGQSALLLSGGLDSALLAWAACDALDSGPAPLAFTTAVPPDSAMRDEMHHAGLVAQYLDMDHRGIIPDPADNSYRPSNPILAGAQGPVLSNRHCLTAAFQRAAHETGCQLLINGTYGEATLTARLPCKTATQALLQRARQIVKIARRAHTRYVPVDAFHVRIAPNLLDRLPEEIAAAAECNAGTLDADSRDGLLGYQPVAAKALAHPNAFHAGAVRMDFPYRDLRLLRLFASFPQELAKALGPDRGPARTILRGRLPPEIVRRRHGLPADPDHFARLQRQAPLALARISLFRKRGLNAWFDLDWLHDALRMVAARGPADVRHANLVQLTVLNAEMLCWWQDGARLPSSGN